MKPIASLVPAALAVLLAAGVCSAQDLEYRISGAHPNHGPFTGELRIAPVPGVLNGVQVTQQLRFANGPADSMSGAGTEQGDRVLAAVRPSGGLVGGLGGAVSLPNTLLVITLDRAAGTCDVQAWNYTISYSYTGRLAGAATPVPGPSLGGSGGGTVAGPSLGGSAPIGGGSGAATPVAGPTLGGGSGAVAGPNLGASSPLGSGTTPITPAPTPVAGPTLGGSSSGPAPVAGPNLGASSPLGSGTAPITPAPTPVAGPTLGGSSSGPASVAGPSLGASAPLGAGLPTPVAGPAVGSAPLPTPSAGGANEAAEVARVRDAIEASASSLWYVSEADYPYDYVFAPRAAAAADSLDSFRDYLGVSDSRPAEESTLDDFFGHRVVHQPGETAVEHDDVVRHQALKQAIEANLTGIKVYRVGGPSSTLSSGSILGTIDVWVVGRDAFGNLVGIRTTSVET